ncbi:hypothetical protein IW261DRAFT_1573093 [Armillaria novae-zelandiae]|uniref:Uncharacterized protein n=1 Tax=Armillaria novae-zelandiae TaxID=153914 RepID=A0AA39NRT2_9AGAR|nr:hypothetical protein IW261DRAFT_1573093 [Armillaria novae-zelandiae]
MIPDATVEISANASESQHFAVAFDMVLKFTVRSQQVITRFIDATLSSAWFLDQQLWKVVHSSVKGAYTISPPSDNDNDETRTPVTTKHASSKPSGIGDISSPHDLTAFVKILLEQLDSKFNEMSTQILDRMTQMSSRVDVLEASIQDIVNGEVSVPQSPSPIPGSSVRRSDSGF